ncbi:YggU-like protein [Glonium stellatum]|uniref:YggU-like protein n=1 Tax=Glonium stellatum TaxID=574774 RepID=A0A8E2EQ39_9PEZI|nr:YggU-like protein [Glonium stellatum]
MLACAIRSIAIKGAKKQMCSVQLLCHVQPGVSPEREGIAAVMSEIIDVRVAAQAREGEANKAVRELIAKILDVPKSDVEITKGTASRRKTVLVRNIIVKGTLEDEVERIRVILKKTTTT